VARARSRERGPSCAVGFGASATLIETQPTRREQGTSPASVNGARLPKAVVRGKPRAHSECSAATLRRSMFYIDGLNRLFMEYGIAVCYSVR